MPDLKKNTSVNVTCTLKNVVMRYTIQYETIIIIKGTLVKVVEFRTVKGREYGFATLRPRLSSL